MKLAVVVLNYNGVDLLAKFLPTLVQHSAGAKLYLADNGSTDNSVAFVAEHFPEITCIRLEKNLGFAGGYNAALQQISADVYCLLNSDVAVTANWIAPNLAWLNENSSHVACSPKILSYKNPEYFEHAGAAGGFLDVFGYPFCRGRIYDCVEKDNGQYNQTTEVFWATGACLFIKSKVFHELGGFDADFFAHMEEIDLCWRLKNRAYKIAYIADSHVFHLGGGTLSIYSPFKLFLNFRNSLFMLVKNYRQSNLALKILQRLVLDGFAALLFLCKGDWRYIGAIVKAHWAFFKALPKFMQKRRLENANIKTPSMDLYPKSIAFDFFVQGKKYFKEL